MPDKLDIAIFVNAQSELMESVEISEEHAWLYCLELELVTTAQVNVLKAASAF